jgi:hypothetical protein
MTIRSNDGNFSVEISCQPCPPTYNQPLTLTIRLLSAKGGSPRFDAFMPDHGHGLVLPFRLVAIDETRFEVQDLVLHMPGYWEFYVDLETSGRIERAQWAWEIPL